MREIKFRAWHKHAKVMIFDWQENDFSQYGGFDGGDSFEVMQYTGLKDKNGKEIYEGDVLEVFGEIAGVYYSDACAGFRYQKQVPDYSVYPLGELSAPAFEIIGNKYENPELVEVKE